jgi:hypothetical protein
LDTAVRQIGPYLQQVIADFSSNVYKQQHIAEKGILFQALDTVGLHGGAGLEADDFDDVAHALQTVLKDVEDLETLLNNCNAKAKDTVTAINAQNNPVAPTDTTAPTGAAPQDDEIGTKALENDPDLIDLMEQYGS